MSISTLSQRLSRLSRIRRRVAYERARSGPGSIRLLRLQVLLLKAQSRLADLISRPPPTRAAIPVQAHMPCPSSITTTC